MTFRILGIGPQPQTKPPAQPKADQPKKDRAAELLAEIEGITTPTAETYADMINTPGRMGGG